jgi:hypothetical protein
MSGSNPKQAGTPLIDCIPQTGECPVGCAECFYNGGRFYRTLDEPLLPTAAEAAGKIVRVNSGHDSNIDRDLVINLTKSFPDKFYNTAIPKFGFPGPTIFTANGKGLFFLEQCKISDVMAVRVRFNSWDLDEQDKLICHYHSESTPIIITWLRYYSAEVIPDNHHKNYSWRQSVINEYWTLFPDIKNDLLKPYRSLSNVYSCSPLWSSYCTNCGVCELLYRRWKAANPPPFVFDSARLSEEELNKLTHSSPGELRTVRDRGFSIQ